MSRQREWQKRKLASGLCLTCGAPRGEDRLQCDPCLEKRRADERLRKGCQPHRPGGRGRPPKP